MGVVVVGGAVVVAIVGGLDDVVVVGVFVVVGVVVGVVAVGVGGVAVVVCLGGGVVGAGVALTHDSLNREFRRVCKPTMRRIVSMITHDSLIREVCNSLFVET